jgi:hypothetical protein
MARMASKKPDAAGKSNKSSVAPPPVPATLPTAGAATPATPPPPRSTLIKHPSLARLRNPIRQAILKAMEEKDMNPYGLASAVRGKVTSQSVYDFVAGRSDMTSKFVVHLLWAVGLDILPKDKGKEKANEKA